MSVVGIPAIAQLLLLDFEPNIVAIVERPRVLRAGSRSYEISFWCCERDGRERMLLLVPSSESTRNGNGRRYHREAEALIDAAKEAQLPLEFVHASELRAHEHRIALAYRLLPLVQTAHRLSNRLVLSNAILDVLVRFHRVRFSQLTAALDGYAAADVHCVLADLLHRGMVVSDAADRLLRSTNFEKA